MKLTDHEGHSVTVTFTAKPEDVFTDIDHDPDWMNAMLTVSGDERLAGDLLVLLSQPEVRVLHPSWYAPICKWFPEQAVLTAAVPLGLVPDPDGVSEVNAAFYRGLLEGRFYGESDRDTSGMIY